jgi:hypothetical protein
MTKAEYMREWRRKNPDAARAIRRRSYLKNGSKAGVYKATYAARHRGRIARLARDRHLRRTYGITLERYESMLAQQGGVCAICSRPPKRNRLAVDHSHASECVRGLLCTRCNRAVGLLWDDPAIVERALNYLKKFVEA